MNIELQKYYEARFDMFSNKGWKDLIEDVDVRIAAIDTTDGVATLEQLHARKGELDALRWLKALPDVSREIYDKLKEDGDIK